MALAHDSNHNSMGRESQREDHMLGKFVAPYRTRFERWLKRWSVVLLSSFSLTLGVQAAPGDLDSSFGGSGFRIAGTIGSSSSFLSAATAIQADGKIIVAGRINTTSTAPFALARYTASGVLDPTFGTGGITTTTVGLGGRVTGITIQTDGKIVAVGTCAGLSKTSFCLARFNVDGTLDTSFSGDGRVLASIGNGNDSAHAVALQNDGKIVVAGTCDGTTNRDFCLARFEVDGSFDTSFGVLNSGISGFDTPGNGNGKAIFNVAVDDDEANALALGSDGSFYVGGHCGRGSGGGGVARFCVMGLIMFPSGTLGSTFTGSPLKTTDVGLGDVGGHAIALQSTGILMAGFCAPGGNREFCVTRYFLSGTLDTSFGTSGLLATAIGTQSDYGRALALQSDGKFIVAGYCDNDAQTRVDFCLSRHNSDGSLDSTFSGDGKVIAQIGPSGSQIHGLAIQSDGRVVAAGVCDTTSGGLYDLCVARFFATSAHTANCSLNIDGMSGVYATTDSLLHLRTIRGLASANGFNLDIDGDLAFTFRDSLLHARIALGFKGDEVVQGIAFNFNATRTNWASIRGYYNVFCGATLPP
jgi:uncharacterized delta-60 repeat protein